MNKNIKRKEVNEVLMSNLNYEYETSPRKFDPKKIPNKRKNIDYKKQVKINEMQRKEALKLEKKKHTKNVVLILAIFLILLAVSYRSSLINEKFNEIQNKKNELASLEKTNGQLEVNIEGSVNLNNIEESAKEKLGMQRLENSQKVYIALDKKDYVEAGSDEVDITNEENISWFEKIINKILKK